ncbi:MAG: hypothetical protein K8T91_03775 [Planctomycetes bacterium]|nr:hypothetical protein [Planctomycetota bacterium]
MPSPPLVLSVLLIAALALPALAADDETTLRPQSTAPVIVDRVDWPSYLARHDLLWNRLPQQWYQAPFLGNGMLGTMVRQVGPQAIRFDVDRCDVQEHRPRGKPGECHVGQSRLPIGHFTLDTVGKLTGCDLRLSLYNAELTGTLTTDRGTIGLSCYVHAQDMVIVVELAPSEGESQCRLNWHPAEPVPPRIAFKKIPYPYDAHPPLELREHQDIHLCVQRYHPAGEAATAWQNKASDGRQTLMVTVAYTYPKAAATAEAVATLERFAKLSRDEQLSSHRKYWHAFYPQSFVSIPDPWWESFYWIQMYKLASATRSDRALIDNTGPWLQPTPWAAVWWDLNVQLTYWAPLASNRLELAESLANKLDANVQNLRENVPEPYRKDSLGISVVAGQDLVSDPVGIPGKLEKRYIGLQYTGLLSWALHDYWLYCRFKGDDERLRSKFFPLLKEANNYYLHFLETGADGKLHLPATYSPEYAIGPDCNFDLALLRWGCQTLVETCERLKIDDPLLPRWREVLSKLADYPVDNTGYMIARDVPLKTGHRHYSHLLMAYPLYLVNADQPDAKPLVMKSVDHWQGLGKQTGYSCTGASSLCAAFGEGEQALKHLAATRRFVEVNTLYREMGPVIETPLSAAQSIHDMLIQSWGDTIRVFPAAPPQWADISFRDLRTEGSFLVTAQRRGGQTQWIRIKNLAGEPCRLKHDLAGPLTVLSARNITFKALPGGAVELDLKCGEEVVLHGNQRPAELIVAPVNPAGAASNPFGLQSGK